MTTLGISACVKEWRIIDSGHIMGPTISEHDTLEEAKVAVFEAHVKHQCIMQRVDGHYVPRWHISKV